MTAETTHSPEQAVGAGPAEKDLASVRDELAALIKRVEKVNQDGTQQRNDPKPYRHLRQVASNTNLADIWAGRGDITRLRDAVLMAEAHHKWQIADDDEYAEFMNWRQTIIDR